MAGENGGTPITYNDIDANKMLNKAGLLELSGQIKGYIQANAGGGTSYTAGDGIDITNDVISSTVKTPRIIAINQSTTRSNMSEANKTYLTNLYLNGYASYPCIIQVSNTLLQTKVLYYFYQIDNASRVMSFIGALHYPGYNDDSGLYFIKFGFDSNNVLNSMSFAPYGGSNNHALSAGTITLWNSDSPTGNKTTVSMGIRYIKNNYAKKSELPPIPADPSNDGTYVLQNTVSSGTATYSWGTPSGGGGGTTYTAGTGISIENGVISINLANAEEEEF